LRRRSRPRARSRST
jgi:hypothetical protein